jgi:mycothiol synthase
MEAMDLSQRDLPSIRNHQPGDERPWLALIRACPDFDEHFFNRSPSLDALRVVVEHPHMDPARSLFFADSGSGFAGYAEVWCAEDQARAVGRVLVHPHWRRRGLGSALLLRIEQRAQAVGSNYLDMLIAETHAGGRHFLQRHDFSAVHYGWLMRLPQLEGVPAPQWPPGYGMRTFVVNRDEQATAELENTCFGDEWEYTPEDVGEIEGFVRSPSFRPDGVIFAVHHGELVGECWSWIDDDRIAETGERQGDVWSLCVHPEHRGRGLGRALLLAGLQWLKQQGMTSALGGVDGANERGQHLYKSVGCEVLRTDIWYRKHLVIPPNPTPPSA